MRRICLLLTVFITVLLSAIGVSAEPQATTMSVHATVGAGGDCQVTSSVTVHLDQSIDSLQFPLPKEAFHISLNGSRTAAVTSGSCKFIDLSRALSNFAGDFSFTVTYSLPDRITERIVEEKGKDGEKEETRLLELHLPMMSGFSFPTQALDFTVTMPGNVESKPGFSSGYHQQNIEQDLSFTVDGAVITGNSTKALKDHETLEMILPVTEEMFPRTTAKPLDLQQIHIAIGIAVAAALLYWLLFLRCLPAWGPAQANPPEGYSAGQLHSVLDLGGADLTLMVFTWAQLGYVTIEQEKNGRVRLYKLMQMGNERSSFECRCFAHLFGTRQMVDTSGSRYGELMRKVRKTAPNIPFFMQKRTGNREVFRFLSSLIGLCCGIGMSIVLGAEAGPQWPVAFLLALLGFGTVYIMQTWISSLFSLRRKRFWISLLLVPVWVIPAAVMGQAGLGLMTAAAGLIGGLLLFCGGRRTAAGRVAMNQVFGLGLYLFTNQDLQDIFEKNPEYFFDLAPCAMALGADMRFASHFRSLRMPPCPYIRTARSEGLSARQWCIQMRKIADAMSSSGSGAATGYALRFLRSVTAPAPKKSARRRPRRRS